MGKLIIAIIGLIVAGVLWFMSRRHEKQVENAYVKWMVHMKANGAKFSVPVDKLEIISTTKRDVVEHGSGQLGRAMAMSEYLGMSEPQYETTILTRFRTYVTINGTEMEVFSQLYPKDKQNMMFALMGKNQIDVYITPDRDTYFDV